MFASGTAQGQRKITFRLIGGHVHLVQRKRLRENPDANRAAISHQQSQAHALAKKYLESSSSLACTTFDDTDMWVKRPVEKTNAEKVDEAALGPLTGEQIKTKKILERRGRNVHLPIFNCIQHHYFRTRGDDPTIAVVVGCATIAPAQVLPKANAMTITDRLRRWTVSALGAGRMLAKNAQELKDHVNAAAWKQFVYMRDALTTNENVIGFEQQAAAATYGLTPDQRVSIFSASCAAHACVLTVKPLIDAMANCAANIVRLGHLLENGRTWYSYIEKLKAVHKTNFKYRLVESEDRLPADFASWHQKARRVLERARPGGDLTRDQEERILASDNGDWDCWDSIPHYCVVGKCTLGCDGDARRSEKINREIWLESFTTGIPVALLYRWKRFQEAASVIFRLRKQHGGLDQAIDLMYPKKRVEDAEELIDVAARGGQEVGFAVKRAARAGKVKAFFAEDKGATHLEKSLVLSEPCQGYLNKVLAASKATTAYSDAVEHGDVGPGVIAKRTESQKRNFEIMSGSLGVRVVKQMTAAVRDFNDPLWQDLKLTVEDKHETAGHLMKGSVDAFKRLVIAFKQALLIH